jgi:1-acyl-sn-glycerol-3-phosphate acyltransferase
MQEMQETTEKATEEAKAAKVTEEAKEAKAAKATEEATGEAAAGAVPAADPAASASHTVSTFDETDDLVDAIPAPPPAVRGCSLPGALPPLESTGVPTPANAVSNDPYAAYRTHKSALDSPEGGAVRHALRQPDVVTTEASPFPDGAELERLAKDGAAGEGKEPPATWRSKSKPPSPIEAPSKAASEPKRRGPRTPGRGTPTLDLEGDSSADVAPIGPTEIATAPSGPPVTEPKAPTPPEGPAPSPEEITSQINDLEARLDRLIRQSREGRGPVSASGVGSRVSGHGRRDPVQAANDEDADSVTARELFSTDFYLRQWGRMGMRNRSEEVDEFGLDPKYEARYAPFFDFLYKHYFRVDTQGTENIPGEGRCLIVSNHSGGTLPYDGIMLRTTLRHEHPDRRELRWLAEDFIYYLPFVGAVMNRLGAVRACQENAERLLDRERLVAVFPEGAKGTGKLYKERYRLQRFGRGGFIRLCLRTQTPLVPCAIIGAEEANPMLYRIEYMTKALGIPYLPITPTFPALGPLGLLPAPTKWKIRFGEPLRFDEYGPEAADDEILVGRLAERVRGTVQGLID